MKPNAVTLVEQVINSFEQKGGRVSLDWCEKPHSPVPVPAKALAKLTFPGNKRLPPSLRRWLAFDGKAVGLFKSVAKATWRAPRKIGKLCRDELAEDLRAFDEILPGDCYLVPGGTEQRHVLYLGKADEHGEYPIFTIDPSGVPMVALSAPSFGVYLAQLTEVIDEPPHMEGNFEHRHFKAAMRNHARLNFHGWSSAELESHGNGIDGKHKPWPASKAPRVGKSNREKRARQDRAKLGN